MKNTKYFMIISLVFTLFLSISSISASDLSIEDMNNTNLVSTEINQYSENTDLLLNTENHNYKANNLDKEIIDPDNPSKYSNGANNYYVSNNGSDDNSGTLESPFKTIQKAVNQSNPENPINIYLLEGVYANNGNVNLFLKNDINLIGISSEKTILDGSDKNWLFNISNGILNIQNLSIQNFYLKLNQNGLKKGIITSDSEIIFKNVEIKNNNIEIELGDNENSTIYSGIILSTGDISLDNTTAYNNHVKNLLGSDLDSLRKLVNWGGLISSFKSTSINNSKFYNNSASRSSIVYADTLSHLNVENSIFENNTANYAGGVFLTYLNTTTKIKNCIFKKNNGTNAGGIIYQQRYSSMFVENCTFENNYANTGGSLYAHHYSNLTANNSTFISGTARTGAAIIGADFVVLNIEKCVFENNTAHEGAVMGDEECTININNCSFNNNIATFGGAVFGDLINNITITNSKFNNNSAEYGGVIFGTFESNIKIINNTFNTNKANNGSVVFIDNTGKLDEEPETPEHGGITSTIYSVDNIFKNNTSRDKLIIVNYENLNDLYGLAINGHLSSSNITTFYQSDKYLTVKLVDDDGKAISNVKLLFKVDSKNYYAITDSNGIAKLKHNFNPSIYNVEIISNDNQYNINPIKSSIKITKAPVTIKAKKLVVKYKKSAKFTIKVINKNTKKALKNIKVKIKVYTGKKYKTYTIKTNSKGQVRLNTKNLKIGNHKVSIAASGYYKGKISSKIIIKK